MKEIMKGDKERKGGLIDYFYNIFSKDLHKKHKKAFNSVIEDWNDESELQGAIQDIEAAYANISEREADGFDITQEPEPLDSQKEKGHLEDFGALPLTKRGEGDESEVAMNDVQQGETGEKGLIQDKGDYIEVTLYVKNSKFEYL